MDSGIRHKIASIANTTQISHDIRKVQNTQSHIKSQNPYLAMNNHTNHQNIITKIYFQLESINLTKRQLQAISTAISQTTFMANSYPHGNENYNQHICRIEGQMKAKFFRLVQSINQFCTAIDKKLHDFTQNINIPEKTQNSNNLQERIKSLEQEQYYLKQNEKKLINIIESITDKNKQHYQEKISSFKKVKETDTLYTNQTSTPISLQFDESTVSESLRMIKQKQKHLKPSSIHKNSIKSDNQFSEKKLAMTGFKQTSSKRSLRYISHRQTKQIKDKAKGICAI